MCESKQDVVLTEMYAAVEIMEIINKRVEKLLRNE